MFSYGRGTPVEEEGCTDGRVCVACVGGLPFMVARGGVRYIRNYSEGVSMEHTVVRSGVATYRPTPLGIVWKDSFFAKFALLPLAEWSEA